jgi:hypothetical protein
MHDPEGDDRDADQGNEKTEEPVPEEGQQLGLLVGWIRKDGSKTTVEKSNFFEERRRWEDAIDKVFGAHV